MSLLHVRELILYFIEGVVARCGTFLLFREILPDEEAHCKPLCVPKYLGMVARGLWMIPGVSFCLAGGFLLLPGGFSRLLG